MSQVLAHILPVALLSAPVAPALSFDFLLHESLFASIRELVVSLVPFVLANLIPAFTGSSLFRYTVTTFFGIIPGGLVFTSVGAGLGEVFERGETPDLGIIFSPPVLLPLLGLAALSALPMVLKAFRKGV